MGMTILHPVAEFEKLSLDLLAFVPTNIFYDKPRHSRLQLNSSPSSI